MLKKLVGQTAIYGISSIVARLLNYLLLAPYFTRVMGPAEYGVITDMYALIPFALVILTMGLETGYFRFAGQAESEAGKKRVFGSTWGVVSLAAAVFFAVVLLFRNDIADATGYSDHPSYIWCVGLIIALDAASAIPFARLREQGRAGLFVGLRMTSVVVNLVLCLFFLSVLPSLAARYEWLSGIWDPNFGVGYVFVANLVASTVVLLLLVIVSKQAPRIDRRIAAKALLYSFPLLLSGIAGTANEYIDRQMIKYLLPDEVAMSSLGIYGAVVKIAVVMLLFTQMYRLAAEPFFLSGVKSEDFRQTNAHAMKYYVIVSAVIFLGVALFADLFALIVGADFRSGIAILPVVLATNILTGLTFNLSFWYKQSGQTRYALYITGTGLAVTLLFTWLLVPAIGYAGAAWASLLCSLATTVLSYILSRRHYPIPYDLRAIGLYLLLGAILYCVGFLSARLPAIPKYIINFVLVLAFIGYATHRERLLEKIKHKQL
ncbi:MAG: polysaccharide biosynthesis C-terminal domain-containing protein [Rikenellaceae bacterium]|jgi:O-antigen/teichoic acid export membrane protein|nr:polysaccharide biosynthesis C-terminal domain-containing protein [Rikenellaceae bacterium]